MPKETSKIVETISKWEYIAKGENTQVILANSGVNKCDELEGSTEKLRLRVSSYWVLVVQSHSLIVTLRTASYSLWITISKWIIYQNETYVNWEIFSQKASFRNLQLWVATLKVILFIYIFRTNSESCSQMQEQASFVSCTKFVWGNE